MFANKETYFSEYQKEDSETMVKSIKKASENSSRKIMRSFDEYIYYKVYLCSSNRNDYNINEKTKCTPLITTRT